MLTTENNYSSDHLTATLSHVREKYHGRPLTIDERQETNYIAEELIHLRPETVRLLLSDTDQILAWADRHNALRAAEEEYTKKDVWMLFALYLLVASVVILLIVTV